jgi:hypothetical protein
MQSGRITGYYHKMDSLFLLHNNGPARRGDAGFLFIFYIHYIIYHRKMSNSRSLDAIARSAKNPENSNSHEKHHNPNNVINALNIKAIIGLFVIFICVTNTLFTEHILSKIKGTYNGTQLSVLGIIIQSIIMILLYILLLYLIKYEII